MWTGAWHTRSHSSRPRYGRLLWAAIVLLAGSGEAGAVPYLPSDDSVILAHVPRGAAYAARPMAQQTEARLDVALPLAQFYIGQARATGDLRFLGYADAVLAPWLRASPADPSVLVLHATILQSRHSFSAALRELDLALQSRPDDAQGWLTRATVLRVLGRYAEAETSCERMSHRADAELTTLCVQSVQALQGQLPAAYDLLRSLPTRTLTGAAAAWRYSELGEMALALGDEASAGHWFAECLTVQPDDTYTRAAYADLLLRGGRAADVLPLLRGYESMEPLLLRLVIAQQRLHDPHGTETRALLAGAFMVEEQRGEAIHRREQARFLLDVEQRPAAALAAAVANWQVQHEPEDVLILLRAASAAGQPLAAEGAREFVRVHHTQDVRFLPYLESAR
jgi:tetratricopeptide (TPR) repeat protein